MIYLYPKNHHVSIDNGNWLLNTSLRTKRKNLQELFPLNHFIYTLYLTEGDVNTSVDVFALFDDLYDNIGVFLVSIVLLSFIRTFLQIRALYK